MTRVLPLIVQRKETIWRFQVKAHVAYTCKQNLGLCHPNGWKLSVREVAEKEDLSDDEPFSEEDFKMAGTL